MASQDSRTVSELSLLTRPIRSAFESGFSWETSYKQAQLLASFPGLRPPFAGNVSSCLFAIEQARQLSCSPFDITMYVRFDADGGVWWHPAFQISQVNRSRKFKTDLDYEEGGEGDARHCTAFAYSHVGAIVRGPKVTIAMMRQSSISADEQPLHDVNPELALRYRAASYFVRTRAPEVLISLRLSDEIADARDASDVLAGASGAHAPVTAAPSLGASGAFGGMALPTASSRQPAAKPPVAGRRVRRRGVQLPPEPVSPAGAAPVATLPAAGGQGFHAAAEAHLPASQVRLDL